MELRIKKCVFYITAIFTIKSLVNKYVSINNPYCIWPMTYFLNAEIGRRREFRLREEERFPSMTLNDLLTLI